MQMFISNLASPLGDFLLVSDAQKTVRALDFLDHKARLHRGSREHYDSVVFVEVCTPPEITEAFTLYFSGELEILGDLRTEIPGTEIQLRIWGALSAIPVGTTTTYGNLAKELGIDDPREALDIGAAVGANSVAIIVPCHRVIASNGVLKGYPWGIHRKRWLLEHENVITPNQPTLPGI